MILVLEEFRKESPEMPIQQALTFLRIAEEEGETVTDVAKRAGLVLASVSRHVEVLGQFRPAKDIGLSLIDDQYHPTDRRRKVLTLTDKGRGLVNRVVSHIAN